MNVFFVLKKLHVLCETLQESLFDLCFRVLYQLIKNARSDVLKFVFKLLANMREVFSQTLTGFPGFYSLDLNDDRGDHFSVVIF